METKEAAVMFRNFAFFLDEHPDFKTGGTVSLMADSKAPYFFISYYDKKIFVEAVKAIGDCTKEYTQGDYSSLHVTAKNFPIKLSIPRDRVCKKIVTFDCEPLFSTDEVEAL